MYLLETLAPDLMASRDAFPGSSPETSYSAFQLSPIHEGTSPRPADTPLLQVRRGEGGEVHLYSIQVKTAIFKC